MTRSTTLTWLVLAVAAPLCAQGEGPSEEQRRALLELLSMDQEARAARVRDFSKRFQLAQTPRDARSALVVMPEMGDVIRLQFGRSALELHCAGAGGLDRTCGSWSPMYPGPFTACAVGPHDIVVAMSTGNASSQTTVSCFSRPDATKDFVLSAQAVVSRVDWKDPKPATEQSLGPSGGSVLAWHAESRTATMAFASPGLDRVVVADVVLTSEAPPEPPPGAPQGRLWRKSLLPRPAVAVTAECLGTGVGAEALDVDGRLHVFVLQSAGLGREGAVRVHVRDRDGKWSAPAAVANGVSVEPEFVAWRDADGRVCLTTPVSDVRENPANRAARELFQTLRTFRMDAQDASKWTLAPAQFAWSGALRLGQQLRVVHRTACAVVLQTATGEVIEQAPRAPEPRRDK
ncbi:MAG TPA: hypothetical protein VF384_15105 [Planctomycetota bacterium]